MANPPKDRTELLKDKARYKAGKISLDELCKKYGHTKSSMKTLLTRAEEMQKRWEHYKRGTSRQPGQPLKPSEPLRPSQLKEPKKVPKPKRPKEPFQPSKPFEPSQPSEPKGKDKLKVHWELPRELVARIRYKATVEGKAVIDLVRDTLNKHF